MERSILKHMKYATCMGKPKYRERSNRWKTYACEKVHSGCYNEENPEYCCAYIRDIPLALNETHLILWDEENV